MANVNPALVLFDKDGGPYSIRYDAVNAMLLNEFLKEHRRVEEQEATRLTIGDSAIAKGFRSGNRAANAKQQKLSLRA